MYYIHVFVYYLSILMITSTTAFYNVYILLYLFYTICYIYNIYSIYVSLQKYIDSAIGGSFYLKKNEFIVMSIMFTYMAILMYYSILLLVPCNNFLPKYILTIYIVLRLLSVSYIEAYSQFLLNICVCVYRLQFNMRILDVYIIKVFMLYHDINISFYYVSVAYVLILYSYFYKKYNIALLYKTPNDLNVTTLAIIHIYVNCILLLIDVSALYVYINFIYLLVYTNYIYINHYSSITTVLYSILKNYILHTHIIIIAIFNIYYIYAGIYIYIHIYIFYYTIIVFVHTVLYLIYIKNVKYSYILIAIALPIVIGLLYYNTDIIKLYFIVNHSDLYSAYVELFLI